MTDLNTATDNYTARKIGDVVDDEIYTWRGMWVDKPDLDTLNVGNLIVIEDFPPYVGSVWKRAAVPVIFPVAGVQAIGLITEEVVAGDNIENEAFPFQFPVDGFFNGTFFDLQLFAEKAGVTDIGTFKIYAQAWDDALDGPAVAKTLVHTFTMDATDRRLEECFILKLVQDGEDWTIVPIMKSGDLTTAYPAAVTLPAQATPSKMMTFSVTYQCDGEALTVKHGKASFNAG